MTPAVLISVCALVFTVGSFWWINLRPGRLRLTDIQVFSACVHPDSATLRIPVTFYNTGAKPLIVVDLRVELTSAGITRVAPSKTFRTTIVPKRDDIEDSPHPFVVPGRKVVTKFVEFDASPVVISTGKPSAAGVQALVGRRWRATGVLRIRTDIIGDPQSYISYSNDPAHWPPGQEKKAQAALETLRDQVARVK